MDSQSRITESDLEWMLLDKDSEPKPLQLSLLEKITDGFSDQRVIGRGGFAVVYKGMLENGVVAVKRLLSNTYMYEKEFLREVECLMKARHKNVVQFLGYCVETQGNVDRYNGKLVMANTKQRLLCFEYLPNRTLDHYIKDASDGLAWKMRYRIIKGICEGLNYLHQQNIMHLDLKPANILLDEDMMPKITDFGLSRLFEEDQTRLTATKVGGTMGYLAPEWSSHQVTHKFDLYSLGVIIREILTGKKGYLAIEDVLEIWSNRLETSQGNAQWKQIRVCTQISNECANFEPANRPKSMDHIISRLAATECAQLILGEKRSELLGVHPFALCFPFEPYTDITCSLHLTNNTKESVAFRLMTKGESWPSLVGLPLYGIVPPKSNYTLIVIARQGKDEPHRRNIVLILEGTRWSDEHTKTFKMHPNGRHFETAKRMGNMVQEVSLRAVHTRRRDVVTSYKAFSPRIKIMYTTGELYTQGLYSLDTNQAKEWILVGEDKGHVRIWNYQTQRKVESIKVSEAKVNDVKFIARKQWFVTGTDNHYIHVYSYENKIQKIASIKVIYNPHLSFAIHPTRPYLLSSDCGQLKLWDWEKGWDCIETFDIEHSRDISQVAFNPNETIASASEDHTVKVWSIGSHESNYTLSGHLNKVNCLNFFICADQEYLITGSDDHTAKIWDLQMKICVYTMEAFTSPVKSAVYHMDLQTLITGSSDGFIYLWSVTNSRICSNNPRLEKIVDIGYRGAVRGLSCLMRGVVIGKEDALVTMDIQQSMDYHSDPQLSGNCSTRLGDTSCKVVVGSNNEVPLLHVHPLELRFFMGCEEPITSPLHLTNKTDEHVLFSLNYSTSHEDWQLFAELPQYDIIPPRSTYTLVVKTKEHMKLEEAKDLDILLQSTIFGDRYIVPFTDKTALYDFLGEAKELGHAVHQVSVKPFCAHNVLTQGETTSEIKSKNAPGVVWCLDAHSTEPWIIIGYGNGTFSIWKYDSQEILVVEFNPIAEVRRSWLNGRSSRGPLTDTFKVSEEPISSVKFIERKQWIVASTRDGFIHVYSCACLTNMQKITSFRADELGVGSLAVNPIHPFLLSSSVESSKLWDMDKGWQCTQAFDSEFPRAVAFNPQNPKYFASTTCSRIKVWSIDYWYPTYTLSGHTAHINCLDFFSRDDGQYLISGSDDCTARIWDLEKRECIHTIGAISSPVVSVISLLDSPYLITCSNNGIVHVWSSINFRLKRTINTSSGKTFRSLACLMGSQRLVIGQEDVVSIINIDNGEADATKGVSLMRTEDEEVDASEGVSVIHTNDEEAVTKEDSNENSVPPILDVHPLELHFLLGDEQPITCSLHLTNKTDERVSFRLMDNECLAELPLDGIVPPRSTYTLIVQMKEQMKLEGETDHDLVLQSTICTVKSISKSTFDDLFGEARELGPAVHEVSLKVVYTQSVSPQGAETTAQPVILPRMKVRKVSNSSSVRLCCIDANPWRSWIITGNYDGTVSLWLGVSEPEGQHIDTLKVSEESVLFVKFIARNRNFVAATEDGFIQVFNYHFDGRIMHMEIWSRLDTGSVKSLVVHPVQPYLLLSTSSHINVVDARKVWDSITLTHGPYERKFETSRSDQVAFNPQDANIFASAGNDRQIQVWSIDGSHPSYTLSGHLDCVNCLDFFTRHDGQYLITGSDDCTAKIWDLKSKECIHTMKETIMSSVVSVIALPDGPFLITGTLHGSVNVWSSSDFSLHRTIDVGGGGPVRGLACFKGSRRVVIGQEKAVSILDIDYPEVDINYQEADDSEGTNESSELCSCISWLPSVLCSICNP